MRKKRARRLFPRHLRTAWGFSPAWIKRMARECSRFERYKERCGAIYRAVANESSLEPGVKAILAATAEDLLWARRLGRKK